MSQFAVSRFCVHVESYHGSRPERIVWTPSERAPISGGQSARSAIPTSTPTTGVTTPPDITTTTGISNAVATAAVFTVKYKPDLGPRLNSHGLTDNRDDTEWPPIRVTAGRASPLLGRSGPSTGLVISRQRFVRRCHGWKRPQPLKAGAS